ncbi:MarR family winged helix-turn-helix transcriptional regulator [Pontibacillus salicampi]|uniref:MarR family winged helix-turn-helix transcriptional regulator n=1 Tax=Pontibacillus salicampi TaxID=1449801 RepID=A0ABV6LLP5_9BACI
MITEDRIAELYDRFEKVWMTFSDVEDRFKKYNLSSALETLLMKIIRLESPTTTDLADQMEKTKSAISQMLSKLEEDGFIVRFKDEADKRVQRLELGPKGKQYANDLEQYEQYIYGLFASVLEEKEVSQLTQTFEKLLHAARQKG